MPLTGFEPVTLALLAPCSNQLSYKGVCVRRDSNPGFLGLQTRVS